MEYLREVGQTDLREGIPFFVGLGRASDHKVLSHLNLSNDKKYQ